MSRDRTKILIVAGPTASGKTSAGLELAAKFGGEIVSADSIQIYRLLDIGSAKPTPAERELVRHHLIDIRDPDEDFSAGDYVREARLAIDGIVRQGKLPIVVGGTGLYIRLLLGGIADVPAGDPALRERLMDEEHEAPGTLFGRLATVDPASAERIPQANVRRIIRALEVFLLTGEKLSDMQQRHALQDRPYDYLFICLNPKREVLYERIENRVDSMIEDGLVEEVRMLYARGYSPKLNPLQSLGYRHAGLIVSGEMDYYQAIRLMKQDTRRYAKRQLTWFRSEPEAIWCEPSKLSGIEAEIYSFVEHRSVV
jgi:tRNA dimethylallyltransferase